jgi:hypothetical protein
MTHSSQNCVSLWRTKYFLITFCLTLLTLEFYSFAHQFLYVGINKYFKMFVKRWQSMCSSLLTLDLIRKIVKVRRSQYHRQSDAVQCGIARGCSFHSINTVHKYRTQRNKTYDLKAPQVWRCLSLDIDGHVRGTYRRLHQNTHVHVWFCILVHIEQHFRGPCCVNHHGVTLHSSRWPLSCSVKFVSSVCWATFVKIGFKY